MNNPHFRQAFLAPEASILEALRIIDEASLQIALVVDADGRLLGTVTDGDIRRGILHGVKLEDKVTGVMNSSPVTAGPELGEAGILALMAEKKIHQIPIVDAQRRVAGLAQMDEMVGPRAGAAEQEDVRVVLMLGGQGTRLLPLTQETPKPMLSVGDRPLLETIVGTFAAQGFRHFYFCVNYMADVIERHFGDGSRFGVSISYLHERTRMGTAGALSLLPEDRPRGPLIVMNGDILTDSSFRHLVAFHRQTRAAATMCVREYEQQVPYGIVQTSGTTLQSIVEKPSQTYFVNAGIYVLDPDVPDLVPRGQAFDMPQLFEALKAQGRESAVFPIREYWLDIGRHEDLERARAEYGTVFGRGGGR